MRGTSSEFFFLALFSRLSLSLSLSPYIFSSSHLQVVRGRAQKLRAAVVGRVAAPELRDLAHGTVVVAWGEFFIFLRVF